MVKDSIQNASLYQSLSPRIARALEFARSGALEGLAPGRHDLDGDALYVMVQRNALGRWADARWEAHRRYIDIQFVISGRQIIGYCDISQLAPDKGYDAERDLEFLNDGDGAHLLMRKGDFAIFFPQDAHRPNVLAPGLDAGACVDMAVFKVLI